jgi:arsenite-transporting ATPase
VAPDTPAHPVHPGHAHPPAPVRTLLVTGAGGAGRTAVAAATALAAARGGARTLLLTRDAGAAARLLPAADAAGPAGGTAGGGTATGLPRPAPVDGVEGVDGLYVAVVDTAASFRAGALDLQGRIGSLLALLGAAPLDPEELTELPGADASALLRALRQAGALGEDSPWDLVVVDMPPVREAVALLALPEQLRRYLSRLLPADRQAARALRPVLAQLAGVPMPAEWAYEAAARADRELAAVQAVIDAAGTAVAVVVEPGPGALPELRTARTGLALYGHRPAAVVANRMLPAGSADPFLAGLSGEQQEHLKEIADGCAADGAELRETPHLGRAVRTPQDLLDLLGLLGPVERSGPVELGWPDGRPPVAAATAAGPRPDPWTVEDRLADEGWFVWTLPLPGAGREGLDLVRRGDELVVDAGGFRRIVPLPSALRRCTVAGAALRDGALRVRFTPDPGLWPR